MIDACKAGANIADICTLGDKTLEEKIGKVYNKLENGQKVTKGIAFPTCVSTNDICGHYAPLKPEESMSLEEGDLIKIDLGGHIDGYIGCAAHSILLPGGNDEDRKRKADAMHAAGGKMKLYYTTRELSNHAAELWLLKALGGEVLDAGIEMVKSANGSIRLTVPSRLHV